MKIFLALGVFAIIVLVFGIFVFSFEPNRKSKTNVLGTVSAFSHLDPNQFNQALSLGKYKLIDVRTLDEYNAGHLKNAKQADFYQTQKFSDYLDTLDKKTNYLIYCRTGKRSGEALKIMQSKGFISVSDISGGYNAWATSGFPIEK